MRSGKDIGLIVIGGHGVNTHGGYLLIKLPTGVSGFLMVDDFARLVKQHLSDQQIIYYIEACYAGMFIGRLSNANSIVITSTDAFSKSSNWRAAWLRSEFKVNLNFKHGCWSEFSAFFLDYLNTTGSFHGAFKTMKKLRKNMIAEMPPQVSIDFKNITGPQLLVGENTNNWPEKFRVS